MVLGTDEFLPLARAQLTARGLPGLPVVTVPHPLGGIPVSAAAAKAEPIVDRVLGALTTDAAETADEAGATAREVDAPDDLDGFQAWLMECGWGDGLPAIPPTRARVAAMLRGTRRNADEVVAIVVPRLGRATVEAIAANAVMAGALPEHLPVILAAVEAVADPSLISRPSRRQRIRARRSSS